MASDIQRAAALICEGGLVAFPTETVYGLGANALDAKAVDRIYAAKGRPGSSPLIVHVDSVSMARELALDWPAEAEELARAFWPGPLTLVVRKQAVIPDNVTAGLETVGLRQPAHPVALALVRAAGVPIAAPSANRFTELSPTRAEHVRSSLGKAVDMILDGGPTEVGIESTVLSVAEQPPELLRPGMISREQIEALIGPVRLGRLAGEAHPSPGMHARHYCPRTPLLVVPGGEVPSEGRGAYVYWRKPAAAHRTVKLEPEAAAYAARLYDTLHALDGEGLDWIAVETPPAGADWEGVVDRLKKASSTGLEP